MLLYPRQNVSNKLSMDWWHYYHKREPGVWEEVNEFVLIYCVEGEGWFELDHQRYKITSNQFFILPKHQAHAYGSNAALSPSKCIQ